MQMTLVSPGVVQLLVAVGGSWGPGPTDTPHCFVPLALGGTHLWLAFLPPLYVLSSFSTYVTDSELNCQFEMSRATSVFLNYPCMTYLVSFPPSPDALSFLHSQQVAVCPSSVLSLCSVWSHGPHRRGMIEKKDYDGG